MRATSRPSIAAGTASANPPSGWSSANPGATSTQGVWRARRTARYVNGVFSSAGTTAWAVDAAVFAAATGTPGALPAPTGVRASSTTSLFADATTEAYYATFEYDDNAGFSSPSRAFDVFRSTVHVARWSAPSGQSHIRARFTSAANDGGTRGPWSATATYGTPASPQITISDATFDTVYPYQSLVQFQPDGTMTTGPTTHALNGARWLSSGASASDYEIRATLVSGSAGFNWSGTGSWLSLATTRFWALTMYVPGSSTTVIRVEIRRAGATNVLATATYRLRSRRRDE